MWVVFKVSHSLVIRKIATERNLTLMSLSILIWYTHFVFWDTLQSRNRLSIVHFLPEWSANFGLCIWWCKTVVWATCCNNVIAFICIPAASDFIHLKWCECICWGLRYRLECFSHLTSSLKDNTSTGWINHFCCSVPTTEIAYKNKS